MKHLCHWRIALYLWAGIALAWTGTGVGGEPPFSFTRHRAATLTLLAFEPVPPNPAVFAEKRQTLHRLCRRLIREGGYLPETAHEVFAIENPELTEIDLLLRSLKGDAPHENTAARPGSLPLICAISLIYSQPTIDGLNASIHISRMGCADPEVDDIARGAYSLFAHCLADERKEKRNALQFSAAHIKAPALARKVRGVRMLSFDRLPSEDSIEGRFLRALWIWQHNKSYSTTIQSGFERLRYAESRVFLAVLCAVWYDLPRLPEGWVRQQMDAPALRELSTDMMDMAADGILVAVSESVLDKTPKLHQQTESTPYAQGTERWRQSAPPCPAAIARVEEIPHLGSIPATPVVATTPLAGSHANEDAPQNDLPEMAPIPEIAPLTHAPAVPATPTVPPIPPCEIVPACNAPGCYPAFATGNN